MITMKIKKRLLFPLAVFLLVAWPMCIGYTEALWDEQNGRITGNIPTKDGYEITLGIPVPTKIFDESFPVYTVKNRKIHFEAFQSLFNQFANLHGQAELAVPSTFVDEESSSRRQYFCCNRLGKVGWQTSTPVYAIPKSLIPESDEQIQIVRQILDALSIEYETPFYYAVRGIEDIRNLSITNYVQETDSIYIIRQSIDHFPITSGSVYHHGVEYYGCNISVILDQDNDLVYLSTINLVDVRPSGKEKTCIPWEDAVSAFVKGKQDLKSELTGCIPLDGKLKTSRLLIDSLSPSLIVNDQNKQLIPMWEFDADVEIQWTDAEGVDHVDYRIERYYVNAWTAEYYSWDP